MSTTPAVIINNSPVPHDTKTVKTAYLLWFFLGGLGIHKFYLGKTGMGVAYIFTGGLFLVGLAVDLFTLGRQVRDYNAGVR